MPTDEEFSVDFGAAKELPLAAEGDYLLTIVDYKLQDPQKSESRGKGKLAKVTFKFSDPSAVEEDEPSEEGFDFSNTKLFDNIWIHFENPFGAKPFYEAVFKRELDSSTPVGDKSAFIGEEVWATVYIDRDYDPKNPRNKINSKLYTAA